MPGKRILLVDYDPRSLSHTREVLEQAGFAVSTCGDGLTALDQFKSLTPDLVLLSAMLPKMHGFEVCSNIRKLPGGNATPVVIITDVYKGKRYRVDAINKYGATEYIEKPIEDTNLVNILKGLVKSNGREAELPAEEIADEKTVQFNRDLLTQMVKEVPIGKSNAPAEKKIVNDKPKGKDDISKKLEESLAGLSREVGKKTAAKPKPAETTAAASSAPSAPAKAEDSGPIFTSEDLFTDVIASVERELQSEKILSTSAFSPPAEELVAPTVQIPPPPPAPPRQPQSEVVKPPEVSKAAQAVKPVVPQVKLAPEPAKKKTLDFDSELEKKLSSTLSGLKKDAGKPTAAKPAAPKAAEPPRKAQEPAKPAPAAASAAPAIAVSPPPKPQAAPPPPAQPVVAAKVESKPGVQMLPRVESKPGVAVPPIVAKEVSQEGINFGQYLLLSKIATGGMAELFKAKRKGVEGFEKILAIKRILPHMSDNEEFVTMFIDEAKLAAQLTHHNICQIFDLGKIENSYYIAMEYVHGKDLRAVLKAARTKSRTIPVELAILIVSKVASALDYAHRKRGGTGQPINLVHRDVSPQNILLSYEGEVKLVDFGIAKAATKVHQTQHGALKGKLLYMSPEQAWGRPVDKRSDLFSLGIVLYELLTGRPLFFEENDTEVTILDKVREARVPPLREYNSRVSPDLEKIVTKALKRNPEERYQTAFDFQKDLDNLFYTEGYNATGATLADFIRALFPEDSGQEFMEKESRAATVPEKPVPVPAPQPAVRAQQPAPEKKAEKRTPPPPVEEKRVESPPAAVSSAPFAAPSPTGFRDISTPDIMLPQEPRHFPVIPVSIAAVVIAVVLGVFLMFRGGSSDTAKNTTPPVQQPPKQATTPAVQPTQQQPAPVVKTQTPPPATETPASKLEEQKKKEEEAKKLADQQKADEEKKKEEDRKKQEQAKLDEEQKKAAQQQQQDQEKEEPAPVTSEPQATKVAEAPAPTAQTPVQEQPKVQAPPPQETPKPAANPPEAPKSTVKDGDLVDLTPEVVKPELVNRTNPLYPPAAHLKKVEGTVILSVLVSENGSVSDVKVLRGAGGTSGLNESAVSAVKKWKFKPAVKEGKRVKVWVTYPIVFKLQ
jgi:TonB family protein